MEKKNIFIPNNRLAYFTLQKIEYHGKFYDIFQALLTDAGTFCEKDGQQGVNNNKDNYSNA